MPNKICRAWQFNVPWDWTAFDGRSAGCGPGVALVLLTRAGTPCAIEDAKAVATSTASGSHPETVRETVRDWMSLTGASPTP